MKYAAMTISNDMQHTNNDTLQRHDDDSVLNYVVTFYDYLDVSKSTLDSYRRALSQFTAWLKRENINRPDRRDIMTYRDELKANFTANTVNTYMTPVRRFFQWLAIYGVYPDVAANVKGAKASKFNNKYYLTAEQAQDVLRTIDSVRDLALLFLMITTGLRTIEVIRANIEDLINLGGQSVLLIQGKGREAKDRAVRLDPDAERLIRAWLKEAPHRDKGAPLFQSLSNNNKGGRMTTRAIRGIVKDYFQAVGLDDDRLTAHSTRHTAATVALLNGASLQEVQQLLGHKDIATTMIYSHNINVTNNSAPQRISKAVSPF